MIAMFLNGSMAKVFCFDINPQWNICFGIMQCVRRTFMGSGKCG